MLKHEITKSDLQKFIPIAKLRNSPKNMELLDNGIRELSSDRSITIHGIQ